MGMTDVSAADILEQTQILSGLSQPWRTRLSQVSRVVRFSARQVVFREGAPPPGLYGVGSGLVRVVKEGPTGRQLVLHFAHPGHSFGEVAVFGNFDAPASAEAVEDSVCAMIPRESLQLLLREHHELCLELLGSTARWVRALVELILTQETLSRTLRKLVEANVIASLPDGMIRIADTDGLRKIAEDGFLT